MANVDKDESELLITMMNISEIIDKRLSPSEIQTLLSLLQDFSSDIIGKSEFSKSFRLFFKKKKDAEVEARKTRQNDAGGQETDLEEGEIREDHLEVRAKVDENPRAYVSEERRSERYVRSGFDKKTRILQPDPTDEMSLKRRRPSRRLERMTPSYELIPEEEQCPAWDTVLNNKCRLKTFDDECGHKQLTVSEEVMARCEEDMYEADMLMGFLRSAEESVEKVMKGEMRMKDLGAKFYRCIEVMYCGEMLIEIVRDNQKKVLPMILRRLRQKVDELKDAQESWKPEWKQVFEENTEKNPLRKATRKR